MVLISWRKASHLLKDRLFRICFGVVFLYYTSKYGTLTVFTTKFAERSSKLSESETFHQQTDVVLVSGTYSCTLEEVVQGLKRFLQGLNHIYIVLPAALVQKCNSVFNTHAELKSAHVSCMSEVEVLTFDSLNFQQNALGWQARSDRRHWYYQQFLKLMVFMKIPGLTEQFLIWDADNVLLKPYSPKHAQNVRFLIRTEGQKNKNKCVFALNGTKHIEKYVLAGDKGNYWPATTALLSHGPFNEDDVSRASRPDIVVHQMLFKQEMLRALLTHVCDLVQENVTLTPTECSNNILSRIPRKASSDLGFSEYHLYFTWFALTNDVFIDCKPYVRLSAGVHCTKLKGILAGLRDNASLYAVVETRTYDYVPTHRVKTLSHS